MSAVTVRADELRLGATIRLAELPGVPASRCWVTSLELVGDDVLINGGQITVSKGNPVELDEEAKSPEAMTRTLNVLSDGWQGWCSPVNRAQGHLVEALRADGFDDTVIHGIVATITEATR